MTEEEKRIDISIDQITEGKPFFTREGQSTPQEPWIAKYFPPGDLENPRLGHHSIDIHSDKMSAEAVTELINALIVQTGETKMPPAFVALKERYLDALQLLQEKAQDPMWVAIRAKFIRQHEQVHAVQEVRLGAASLVDEVRETLPWQFSEKGSDDFQLFKAYGYDLNALEELQAFIEQYHYSGRELSDQEKEVATDMILMSAHRVVRLLSIRLSAFDRSRQGKTDLEVEVEKASAARPLFETSSIGYDPTILIIMLMRPTLIEDLRHQRIPGEELREELAAQLSEFLEDPLPLLETLLSNDFRVAVDQALIAKRDQIQSML